MSRTLFTVLKEAFVVGIAVVIIGTLVSWALGSFMKVDLPPVCKDWNQNYIMEFSLFLTGVFAHLGFEYFPTGNLNEAYCRMAFAK